MEKGFIKLFHKFDEWEWYDNPIVKALFIHLLIKANTKSKQWQGITIKRGQLITSLKNLAIANGLTIQQTRTALNNMRKTKEIEIETTKRYSIITVLNYNLYQMPNKQITNCNTVGEAHIDIEQIKPNKLEKKSNKQITKWNSIDMGYSDIGATKPNKQITTTKDIYSNTSYINISLSIEEREILSKYLLKQKRKNPIEDIDAYISALSKNGDLKYKLEKALQWNDKQKAKQQTQETKPDIPVITEEDEKRSKEIMEQIHRQLKRKRG